MRNKQIDIIRGIGIILVVLGHTQMALCSFVNLFHVGLFFIASGFCFQEKYTDNWDNLKRFFIKRIKRLYVPFVVWNLAYMCFHNFFVNVHIYEGGIYSAKTFILQAFQILCLRSGEQLAGASWFVRALFIMEVAFAAIDFLLKKWFRNRVMIARWITAGAMLVLGGAINWFGLDLSFNIGTICSSWMLFLGGFQLKVIIEDRKKQNAADEGSIKRYLPEMVCGLLVLCILSRFGTISYDSNSYPNIFFFLLAAAAGWSLCWGISGCISKVSVKLRNGITYVGQRTMSILFLHLFAFKIVSAIYMGMNRLESSTLSMFPVATNTWWIFYLCAGVFVPLILDWIVETAKKSVHIRVRKKAVITVFVGILFAGCAVILTAVSDRHAKENVDYTLVYDQEYYLEHNPDIRVLGDEEETIFHHFLEYGMEEGRVASPDFDVYFYRANNADLSALYGDDLEKYYYHYMMYGYAENRQGSAGDEAGEAYAAALTVRIEPQGDMTFHVRLNGDQYTGQRFSIFELEACDYEIPEGAEAIAEGILDTTVEVPAVNQKITDKYVVAVESDQGFERISNYSYICNPENFSESQVRPVTAKTKKGLQIKDSMLEDVEMLSPSYAFMNLIIQNIMSAGEGDDTIAYEYRGKNYYFRKDKISEYDSEISGLTAQGIAVIASVISVKSPGFGPLYYSGIDMDTGASFYALNTEEQEGLAYVEAFVTFMSTRYNGADQEKGMIADWVVGNEVNESGTYNYMGEKELGSYLEEYTRTFRVIYNIVKSNIPAANVYVPMEPWWGIDSGTLTYGGKEFLTEFSRKMKEEGDIDWGLAYHAYSFPLSDPKVLNDTEKTIDITGEFTLDGYVTTDSEDSVTITMENIEVLTEFMHKEEMLNAEGEVRSIILSEQGYTANSNLYGKCEAQQAASMLYAYYKAEMNEDIDAFVYFLQADTTAASLGNEYYRFGLWGQDENGTLYRRLSYEVFLAMDTRESLEVLGYVKNILGIAEWEDVIPDFDESVFEGFAGIHERSEEYDALVSAKADIGNAKVVVTETARYTGRECLPEVQVYFEGTLLENDSDYDVVYLHNVEPGEAKIVVVGLNHYQGIKETTFEICD